MILLLFTVSLSAQDAAAIMAGMAANIERASTERQRYLYQQSVRSRFLRTNGKVARQERRQYSVLPAAGKTQKELLKLEGEHHDGRNIVHYQEASYRAKKMDIDGELMENLTKDLVDHKDSRDGIPEALFPLRTSTLANYKFTLVETKPYKGRLTHHISFGPKEKTDCEKSASKKDDEDDPSCNGTPWKGEAWVDAAELQPVHIATELSFKMPFVVRTLFGSNIRQSGFAVTYQRIAENVWFPVSYGTEFRLDVLFGYKRVIALSMESSAFQRTSADSNIIFEAPEPPL